MTVIQLVCPWEALRPYSAVIGVMIRITTLAGGDPDDCNSSVNSLSRYGAEAYAALVVRARATGGQGWAGRVLAGPCAATRGPVGVLAAMSITTSYLKRTKRNSSLSRIRS